MPGDTARAVRRRLRFRFRFRFRTFLVLPVVVGLLLVMFNGCFESSRFGFATVPLEFIVVDSETGRPVPGAEVKLSGLTTTYEAVADRNGRAKVFLRARVGVFSSLFETTRSVHYAGWDLRYDAEGYPLNIAVLDRLTRDRRYHNKGALPPPITIRLGKRPAKP